MAYLNRVSIKSRKGIVEFQDQANLPEKIVQFGEGNFLRGFVDWMVHAMNKQGLFNGKIVAIQPTPHGKVVPKLERQDGLYTLVLQGVDQGEKIDKYEVIPSISKWVNPYENWSEVLKYAESDSIEFAFSNTTEAGLTYQQEEFTSDKSVLSYPGKLTAFLYHRYHTFKGDETKGITVIPCELVEGNGDILKEIVLKISGDWNLPTDFIEWVKNHNRFCNTLVDRIVPGYPKNNITAFQENIGYEDSLLVIGEPYHLFAIDANEQVSEAIPFDKAGLNVKWGDVTPYRNLKVSILNAPHTMMFSIGYLSGVDTVFEIMEDEALYQFVHQSIFNEILPVLPYGKEELHRFAESVLDRFKNPFVKHYLGDLGLNAVSKFKTRVLPTFHKWVDEKNEIPKNIAFSLAGLITYYRPIKLLDEEHLIGKRGNDEYKVRDSKEAIRTFYEAWNQFDGNGESLREVVSVVLDNELLWDIKLSEVDGLTDLVTKYTRGIIEDGMREELNELVRKKE
ncbi:tagaturonate reductase [Metabacillus arenae]|uniref:tagaturonate reductase n=1 Tax=Metabacillus arenae TaxID=2771434 RepID=UPI001CD11A90|nr:tagaturonate reductase [Metabacillus arenae]